MRLCRILAIAPFSLLWLAGCGDDASTAVAAPGVDAGAAVADATAPDATTEPEADATTERLVPEFGADGAGRIVAYVGPNDGLERPRDLGFNPMVPGELWVFDRATDGVVIANNAGTDQQMVEYFIDAFADHFMEEVSSASFAPNGFFGTCGESRNTYNGLAPPDDFMGPALWTADRSIFANVFQDPFGDMLGSHMDMLHQSPLCMGIEYDGGMGMNGYWVADGLNGHLVYYDFREDHGPGADDHSDGVVRRYVEVELTREPNVPSHMALDWDARLLYIADTGADRVLWVNIDSGQFERALQPLNEPLAEFSVWGGVEWGVFLEGIDRPSGMAINENRLFVGEYGTGTIIAYDLGDGRELGRFDTQGTALMGIEISPEGDLWFVDADFAEVTRIE